MSGPGIDIRTDAFDQAVRSIVLRAEKHTAVSPKYVDVNTARPLESVDNQIAYGRRGTGKTHLLNTLVAKFGSNRITSKELPVLVDLRLGGGQATSQGGRPDAQQSAATIFHAVIVRVANELQNFVGELEKNGRYDEVDQYDQYCGPTLTPAAAKAALNHLKQLAAGGYARPQSAELSEESFGANSLETTAGTKRSINASFDATGKIEAGAARTREHTATATASHEAKNFTRGVGSLIIQTAEVANAVEELLAKLQIKRIWVLLDEWSDVALEVQPYLAELIKRTLLTVRRCSVKIMAIPGNTNFSVETTGRRIGIEVGGDAFVALDLDDLYIYAKAPEAALSVFAQILYHHLTAASNPGLSAPTRATSVFVNEIFSDSRAFEELVKACEGNPRDFLNIFSESYHVTVRDRSSHSVGIPAIREAAAQWYERDKLMNAMPAIRAALEKLVTELIRHRKSKAFLVSQQLAGSAVLQKLVALRLLHKWHRGYASKGGKPSERFDIFAIDYGAYIDIKSTELGRRVNENFDFDLVDVPEHEKRAIRHIVLSEDMLKSLEHILESRIRCGNCQASFSPDQKSFTVKRLCPECFEPVPD